MPNRCACWLFGLGALTATFGSVVGCAPEQPDLGLEAADGDHEAIEDERRVLVCMQGLGDRLMDADRGLFALCETAEDAGFELVRDGDYAAFTALDEAGAYAALFDALDSDDDGWIDDWDAPAQVYLVGFSWGGVNVADVANRLRKSWWIADDRRSVTGLVMLDPYQPQRWWVTVPANVENAWEYRQTSTTEGDCSATVSLGFGFNGLDPWAKSSATSCTHYDLDEFLEDVGHCDVPSQATDAALHNLLELEDDPRWAERAHRCDH